MTSSDADQEQPDEHDNALVAESIPEQIRFFDVQFDKVSKEYKVTHLQEDVRDWHDLKCELTCTSHDETFQCGDLVHIKLHNQPNGKRGDDVARIEDIRSFSSADKRRLVLISWLYCLDGTLYESNHLQIVLWDTIARRTNQSLAQQVRAKQLYNVCGGKKFCSDKQAKVWRLRKSSIKRTVG